MPVSNSSLRNPDPFIMNEDTVNIAIAEFLTNKGFDCEPPLTGRQQGIDVKASKGIVNIFVESKGSQKNGATNDEVFTHGQIVNHIARQIHTLMKYATQYGDENNIYVLANPDLQRIRSEYYRIDKMVEKLGFVCMWVQEDCSVVVKCPKNLRNILTDLNLL
ncbi:hypothetical protein NST17_16930 [Caldifermentibacillus hisashii]|jgi:hypothetical protein|uniref:Restriction endonuclease type IV Mrr domain-containing protein n=1 Tax=Caldifermentibacillus hisashii TaxID=996558 RepID=A0ABU9K492_9BACI|nr:MULTISPECIES: hypothetical protein [Bacillaceae]MDL0421939.1 hypothetical protein [Caldibacillus thermoamylovorans]MEC5273949.1 hypothetical protein [Caldifermentibacillus hisashii]